ncbi:MAG: NAD(P)H-dependent oxidoreductase [Chloroflexota bacterium]
MPPEAKRILIIQGHPDPRELHFGHALANAYAEGATEAGHEISVIEIAKLNFPLLHSAHELEWQAPPESIQQAQSAIARCDHLLTIYPVWNGAMTAVLKGSLEQTFCPRSSFPISDQAKTWGFCRIEAAKGFERHIGARCCHHADARVRVSLVLSPPPRTEHAQAQRDRSYQGEPHWLRRVTTRCPA